MTGLPSTPALLVVIHQVSPQHAADQAALAFDNGADGVWLINHFDPPAGLAESVASVRNRLGSELWVGINPLGLDALTAARFARSIAGVDGLWCDAARSRIRRDILPALKGGASCWLVAVHAGTSCGVVDVSSGRCAEACDVPPRPVTACPAA